MNQLYFVPIGNALYWSTSLIEICDFALTWDMLGHVETGHTISFQIPNVICIHKWSPFQLESK